MIYTSLNKIRERDPCSDGWEKLLTNLGKTQADDEPLSLLTILESNGLNDALWCLRACDGIEKEARLYAVACARRVQHLMKDQRSIDALDVAERYAHGKATIEQLKASSESANDAADSADSARVAAWVAAGDAAWDAAWGAASGNVWNAANAAWCAASDAACDAAWSAANAAWDAACAAEIKWQEAEFRKVFCS